MPGDKLKISVIIPAYNEEKNISRCLNSLLNQTHKPHEIIVINDGSTDNTKNIIKEFIKKNKKIRWIDKIKNEGRAKAYISGFNNSKGDIFALFDADSIAHSNWLNKIKEGYIDDEEVCCVGGHYKIYNKNYITHLENIYLEFLVKNFKFMPSGTNISYRKKLIEKYGVFKKIPEYGLNRYPMRILKNKGYKIITNNSYVWSKGPENLKTYIKQMFRWGRGIACVKDYSLGTIIKNIFILCLPLIFLLSILCIWQTFFIWAFVFLIIQLSLLIKIKELTFFDSISLILLKSISLYALKTGFFRELIK